MHIALISGGAITAIGDHRRLFPDTSFEASGPSPAFLAANGALPVVETLDYDPESQKLIPCEPRLDGDRVLTVSVVPLDEADLAERDEQQRRKVREQRDQHLAASDWTQLPDAALAGINTTAWARYRQALRDLPSQPGFPWAVSWPELPITPEGQVICDYQAFYDALLSSDAYRVIRTKAVASAAVLTACVEFIAAIGDAKAGRANPAAIQTCVDLLCAAAQFAPEELGALAAVMAVGGLNQLYTLPAA